MVDNVDDRPQDEGRHYQRTHDGQNPIEDYAEEYAIMEKGARKGTSIKNFVTALTVILVAVAFMAYIKNRDKFNISSISPQEIPVVKADKSPFKIAPADPGGMAIPNRDKKIYDAIETANRDNLPKVIKILPSSEEPVDIEEMIRNESSLEQNNLESVPVVESKVISQHVIRDDKAVKKDIVDVITKLEQDQQLEAVVPNGVVVKKRPLSEKDLIKVTLDEQKKLSKKAPLKKQQKAGDYRIQLGAFKTRGDAEKAFDSIKRKNIDLIENMGFYVQRADLGDKGIFFRLQAGDFTSQQDARKVCAELRERKQGCFIVSVK